MEVPTRKATDTENQMKCMKVKAKEGNDVTKNKDEERWKMEECCEANIQQIKDNLAGKDPLILKPLDLEDHLLPLPFLDAGRPSECHHLRTQPSSFLSPFPAAAVAAALAAAIVVQLLP
ncbi:hypothetical protein NE237_022966 [Protea cynaroides]|uniref:Uncharacterized protein n=1 Tax=Protea cynaroides TaxID=273540 RepID=A0A9Q0HFF3_9MAGN|nr:hypothetical protein NE237_022966 [Protea cynaroides]